MNTVKYLLFSLVFSIIGIAAGFNVSKQTYQPQVAALKEQIAAADSKILQLEDDLKKNVRLVFAHNENCKIEN